MKIYSAFIGAIVLLPLSSHAEYRCPPSGKIIKEGMSSYEVETACGTPTSKTTLTTGAAIVATPMVEEWVYDFGSSRFIQKLRMEGGVLKSIESGTYGTVPAAQGKTPKKS